MSRRRTHLDEPAESSNRLVDLPGRIWSTIHRLVTSAPSNAWEAIWRIFSVSMFSGMLTVGWLVWRYPDVVRGFLAHDQFHSEIIEDIFSRHPDKEMAAMETLSRFIATYGPSHVALINWETQTGIHEVWSSGSTRYWPVTTDGVMSSNMREAVGYLIFDQCWSGDLKDINPYDYSSVSDNDWLVCGLSNDHDIWGYILVHWEGREVPQGAAEALRLLAERLENVMFF